jgi:hypothetical protein
VKNPIDMMLKSAVGMFVGWASVTTYLDSFDTYTATTAAMFGAFGLLCMWHGWHVGHKEGRHESDKEWVQRTDELMGKIYHAERRPLG